MAIPTAVGDFLEITFGCTAEGQNGLNVRHAKVVAQAGAGVTDQVLAEKLSTTFAPEYKGLLSITAAYLGCKVRIMEPIPGIPAFSNLFAGAGSQPGDILPTQVAGLIKLTSDFGGRQGRGRVYVPFPSESTSDASGDPNADYLTRLQDLGDLFVGTFTAAVALDSTTIQWVVSKSAVGKTIPLKRAVPRTHWATQRRRSEINRSDVEFGP